jgi:protein associated with RNAse G/E
MILDLKQSVNRELIYALNAMGFNIMVVYEPDGFLSYLNVSNHIPTTSSSVESIDFFTVQAIDMNDFFLQNTIQYREQTSALNNAVAAYLGKHPGRTRKYHKNIPWVLYLAGN